MGIKPNIRLGYMKLMKQFYMDLILPAATEDILPKELTIDLKQKHESEISKSGSENIWEDFPIPI